MREFSNSELKTLVLELPDEIQKYKDAGAFEEAKKAIAHWMEKPLTEEMKTRLKYETFILEQLPAEFPYTKEQVIRLMQEKLPDYSEKDLEREEEKNLAEWIYADGEKHYIHNLVRNLTDKDEDIRERAGLYGTLPEDKKLLLGKIKEIQEKGVVSDRFRVKTSIKLKDEAFEPGMKVKVHLPLPAERWQTTDVEILNQASGKASIDGADSLYRSICFEDVLEENRTFFVEYAYTVTSAYADLWTEEGKQRAKEGRNLPGSDWEKELTAAEEKEYLEEQLPHIRFSPYLQSLAETIVGDETDPLEKARKIYDYITTQVQYSYMKSYSLIPDIPGYCARNLRGDCGVQALLFITLCRICHVPAKWQSGLYANPAYTGPHDWAMFFVKPYGWLYADPSFGGSAYAAGDENRRRFYFGNLDTYRMAANNAFQQDFAVKKTFMPMDPYDNQSGEMECGTKGFGGDEVETAKLTKEWKD